MDTGSAHKKQTVSRTSGFNRRCFSSVLVAKMTMEREGREGREGAHRADRHTLFGDNLGHGGGGSSIPPKR